MNKAINQILRNGYRNILLVPQAKGWQVLARHYSKNPLYVGDRYEIGMIDDGVFFDNIPF